MKEPVQQTTRREIVMAVAVAAAWALAGLAISKLFSEPARCAAATPAAFRAGVCRVHNGLPGGAANVGSGTLIDVTADGGRGLVLTCAHLFSEGCGQAAVAFASGRTHGALVIGLDRAADLAALEIANPREPPAALSLGEAPPNVLTACGFGPDGAFRCVSGAVVGAAEGPGQVSLKLAGAVRSGDSGGGAFDEEGRLVGVIWGERDGVSYVTSGGPLKQFVEKVIGRRLALASRDWTAPTCPHGQCPVASGPVVAPAPGAPCSKDCACRREIAGLVPRLEALERDQQDRGEYLTRGDLAAYVPREQLESLKSESRRRHESLLARLKSLTPAVGAARTVATTGLGVSGPIGWGLVAGASAGSWLAGRWLARRRGVGGRRDKRFRRRRTGALHH